MKIKRNFISHQKSKSINNHKLSAKEFDTNNNQLNGLPKNNFIYDNNKNGKNLINEDIKNKYEINNISNNINSEEKIDNNNFTKTIDEMNQNVLNLYYDKNSLFKQKIDDLNLKFYLETEKYLSNKNPSEKCQTSLFIILFKQINIYIEEIERLNLIIIKRKYEPKKIIERTDEIIKKQNEFLTKEKLIKTLKESKSYMETKLLESIMNEDKLKKEIQNLKKENAIFKKQLSKNNNTNNHMNINMQKKNSNSNKLNKSF